VGLPDNQMVETNALPISEPNVTIVVTPWQHFSQTEPALESIYAFTQPPFELVYIDGNSPPHIQRYLREQARTRHFTLVRADRYLTTTEAQNLASPHIGTKYVVYIENWVLVTQGWLSSLIRCAEETHAWVVEPLYCTGDVKAPVVYSAAPELAIIEEHGKRRLHETAPLAGKPLADVRSGLTRGPCGYAKSQCMLTRKEVVDRLGAFDEDYTSYQAHRDFSLDVHAAGGLVYFEPDAVVVLVGPPPLAWSDIPMFLLRWSDAWLQPSIRHFARKWRLDENDYMLQGGVRFRNIERRKLFQPAQRAAQRLLGWRGRRVADKCIDALFERVLEPTVIARLERTRLRARGAPTSSRHLVTIQGESDG
jgi:GT2 family glycosyltransferase